MKFGPLTEAAAPALGSVHMIRLLPRRTYQDMPNRAKRLTEQGTESIEQ
jgi:hypothetical protein